MTLGDIAQSLNLTITALSGFIQANNVDRTPDQISWTGYKTGIFKDQYYPLEYQWLLDKRQYSLLLRDSSFLQFYYEFDAKGLLKARAAFYPRPIPSKGTAQELGEALDLAAEMEDESLFDHLMDVVEEIEKTQATPPNTSHVRFDFDRSATSHEVSHLQFGALGKLRVPADFFPTPYAFLKLIAGALENIPIGEDPPSRTHAENQALRNLKCNGMISLAHST